VITQSDATIWLVILALGAGTFAIRFSFLGLAGGRELPPWLLRLLRYVPVSVLPALVAPMVVWPQATGGEPEPARATAACVALAVGAATRHVLAAVGSGLVALYTVLAFTG
jgi:branched-subunit amino acid transport protein